MPGTYITKKQIRRQSLMSTIQEFVAAVDTMQGTVMVPNRLRDIPVSVNTVIPQMSTALDLQESSDESDDNSSSISNDSIIGINGEIIPLSFAEEESSDLYQFYKMLGAVKEELSRNPNTASNDTDGENEPSTRTAAMFRHHLRGLFDVLHQLTDNANGLTNKYQEELGVSKSSVLS